MRKFPLTISSPDGAIFSGEVECIILRGTEGEFAVMAGHTPFVTSVVPCECKVTLDEDTEKIGKTDGGILTVSADGVVLLSGSFTWN